MNNAKQFMWLWLSAMIAMLDQVTKKIALSHLLDAHAIVVLPVLKLSLAFNRGAAFSFLNSASGWQNIFFIGLTIFFVGIMVIWLLRDKNLWQNASLALIIGGALGNLMDRLHYGFVIDFIDAHIGVHHWPTFNVADSAICVGVVLLLIINFKKAG